MTKPTVQITASTAQPKPRWVRVMADYSASGVWNSLGEPMEPDELPVTAAWLERLQAWCAWYEQNDDYLPAVARKRPRFPLVEFNAEGLTLAKALKAELGSEWTVVFFDEVAAAQGVKSVPRRQYEYPV